MLLLFLYTPSVIGSVLIWLEKWHRNNTKLDVYCFGKCPNFTSFQTYKYKWKITPWLARLCETREGANLSCSVLCVVSDFLLLLRTLWSVCRVWPTIRQTHCSCVFVSVRVYKSLVLFGSFASKYWIQRHLFIQLGITWNTWHFTTAASDSRLWLVWVYFWPFLLLPRHTLLSIRANLEYH